MKMSKLFLLAAFLTPFLGSCSNDSDLLDSGNAGVPGEIQLVFNGGSDGEIYTRGIATDSENEIKDLRIYVFASSDQTNYFYQELWSTDATDVAAGASALTLQGTGVTRKTSIFPNEWKGMHFLKLYCVANSGLYAAADGTTAATLTAISDAGDGTGSTAGATTNVDFEAFVTGKVDANPIETPLAMRGAALTKISGNYSKVDVELKRIVARFDIDNDADKTALTIEKISVEKANPYATLFDDPAGAGTLGTYPVTDYTLLKNANAGVSTGALYMNPSAQANKSVLVIEGQYLNPNTKVQVPVIYKLPIAKNPSTPVASGTDVTYVDVLYNHRYTLRISQVTEAEITAMFEIEDWTSGGGVDIKPDNDVKPEIIDVTGATWTAPATRISVDADGDITIVTKATGQVAARIAAIDQPVTRAAAADDADVAGWLVAKGAAEYSTVDGLTQTTLVFTATLTGAADVLLPMNITLVNAAASDDADLQTVLTVIPPAENPVAALSDAYTGSSYNTADFTTNAASPTGTMYKGTDSKLYVDVTCPFGVEITQDANDLFTVRKVATAGLMETYCFTLKDAATAETSATITIANKDDSAKKLEWAITLSDAAVDKTGITAGTGGTYTSADDMLVIGKDAADPIALTIPSVAGVTLAQLDYSWFTVAHSTEWTAGATSDVYTITQKAGKNPAETTLTFVNKVKGGGDVIVKVKKEQ